MMELGDLRSSITRFIMVSELFLGTLECADHWAVRGASGIKLLDVDLASVVGSRDAWGLADWGRFVRALGRVEERGHAERVQQAQGTSASVAREDRALS